MESLDPKGCRASYCLEILEMLQESHVSFELLDVGPSENGTEVHMLALMRDELYQRMFEVNGAALCHVVQEI